MRELLIGGLCILALFAMLIGAITYESHMENAAMLKCMETSACDWNVYRR